MTLTIDLTAAEETRLRAAAQQSGLEPEMLAKKLVTEHLPLPYQDDRTPAESHEKARIAAILTARGSLAHINVTVDDLHLERQTDKRKALVKMESKP